MSAMITRFGCFFLRKLRCSELSSLYQKFQQLNNKRYHLIYYTPWPVSFNHFSTSQALQIPNKIFKCKRLLSKCFLGLTVVLLIKGISLLSHKSFKISIYLHYLAVPIFIKREILRSSLLAFTSFPKDTIDSAILFAFLFDGTSFVTT